MKLKAVLLALALTLAAPFASAQYSAGAYPCGFAASTPLSCVGIPILLNGLPVGTAWLHDYLAGTGPDYIVWGGGMELMPESTISDSACLTTVVFKYGIQTARQCTVLHVSLFGGDRAADTYYTGSATFNFDYYYGGYGRSAGWRRRVTGGAITFVTY